MASSTPPTRLPLLTVAALCGCLLFTAAAAAELPPYLRVVEEDSSGITISVEIPYSAFDVSLTAEGTRRLRIGELGPLLQPGQPELPVLIASIALPDTGSFRLDYQAADEIALRGAPLRAVAEPAADGQAIRKPDPSIYEHGSAIWPALRVESQEVRFRGLRALKLTIHPARYAPGANELLLTRSFRIRVDFGNARTATRSKAPGELELRLADRALLNGKSVLARQQSLAAPRTAARPSTIDRATSGAVNAGVRIRIDQPGIYRITRADLIATGFDPN